jgi:hypothetical protein
MTHCNDDSNIGGGDGKPNIGGGDDRPTIYTDANSITVDVYDNLYRVSCGEKKQDIQFQSGTIDENGVNGLQNEALLAILIHRTKYLNSIFPCRENSIAITKMEEAKMWFDARTKDRQLRNVEGKYIK